jgi:hypothetical protein
MNFTFLVILSLLTLGFTYETLKISQKQLCVIILILVLLLVSYNIKEKFDSNGSNDSNDSNGSNGSNDSNDSNGSSALIFDKTRVQEVADFLDANVNKQVRNDRDIKSELLKLKLA